MSTTKKLNNTDGWENIVNNNAVQRGSARARVASRKRERRLRKLLMATTILAVACIVSVILGAVGSVAGWLATIVAIVCLVFACFLFGRYVEDKKR